MIKSPLCELLGIRHPILLAGMSKVSNPELAAAVTNAGGLGVIGGVMKSPKQLRAEIQLLKSLLDDKDAPFGVDLLLPQVGGNNARATNSDYTKGQLPELIDIIIDEKASLFVSAVGVPPQYVVDRLHGAGILVANMVGMPKHCIKALEIGVDIIIAQGYEAGGHTGDIATSVLVPQVVDACRGRVSVLHGGPIQVVAAGGIVDGRAMAAAFAMGAKGVWVGTRFICATESGATPMHQRLVLENGIGDTCRSTLYTGRPVRCLKTPLNQEWEGKRREEMLAMQKKGVVVYKHLVQQARNKGEHFDIAGTFPQYMGQCIGSIKKVMPAKDIIDEMMYDACQVMQENAALVSRI